jgi:hypothetical protein
MSVRFLPEHGAGRVLNAMAVTPQRKFRGFETFTGDEARARGAFFVVEARTPIIDGTDERHAPARPESWNAKMALSGEPLITEEQFERLLANAPKSFAALETHDPIPVVKIFLPHVRWILGWIYPDDRDRAFAVIKYGNNNPESIAMASSSSGSISIYCPLPTS